MASSPAPDFILHHGAFATLDRMNPIASAVAIKDGRFLRVGSDAEILPLAGPATQVIDLKGRRVLPGLCDNHTHIIRGGLNFNMELRWDGVRSLADAMSMLKRQVAVTPPPQWVRVVGGFTEHQFAEKRLPTLDELNAVAPDTPVFILHLYDRALLNGAALRAVGYTKDTPDPPGGQIVRDGQGNPTGLLLAKPNAAILYATLAKGPKLPLEYQVNSTRHFMRELNRLGVTSVIDAGGGFQNYPEDYEVIQHLADAGQLTVRIAYNLFTQKPKQEKDDFLRWTASSKYKQGDDYFRHNGAGEMLVFSAADFEDFRQPRPEIGPEMEGELEDVVRILAHNRWPWRMHATYDETIRRALDVFERVNRDIPLSGLNWFFDHAETISDASIDRIAALGGGVAVQHRMAALTGRTPQELPGELGACDQEPRLAKTIPVGDGSGLLRRRPDIRRAEFDVLAASDRIGVVTADLYPKVVLGASIASVGVDQYAFRNDSFKFSLGPLISWEFPDRTRVKARIRAAEADREALLARFDGVVLAALKETESALEVHARDQERRAILQSARTQAQNAARDTQRLFEAGRIGYLPVLDALRTLSQVEQSVAAAESRVAADQVNVFLALGGGWGDVKPAQSVGLN